MVTGIINGDADNVAAGTVGMTEGRMEMTACRIRGTEIHVRKDGIIKELRGNHILEVVLGKVARKNTAAAFVDANMNDVVEVHIVNGQAGWK